MPRIDLTFICVMLLAVDSAVYAAEPPASAPASSELKARKYESAAMEVMQHVQTAFYLPEDGLYAHSTSQRRPDFMWGNGIMFSALLGAARHDAHTYSPIVSRFFKSMDRYWDTLDKPPGYEPFPTKGGGNDKYYDDNAWVAIAFCEAYEMTKDKQYLERAQQSLDFVLSGWDEQRGGGIWWHERHKGGSKNTCVNAPAAVACLRIAKYQPPAKAKESREMARKIVEWTISTLEDNGLYSDAITVETGRIHPGKLTYNTALMIRALLGMYQTTHDEQYLRRATASATAANWFLDNRTGAYRDPPKWSHLMVEADLQMYRATHDDALLRRAIDNADYLYKTWKQNPPDELIDNASIARTLWLMADMQSAEGQQFWEKMDRP